MNLNNEDNYSKYEKTDYKEERTPAMILTIDIGNNQLKNLNIYDINNTEQDIYNFCLKNQLDFIILKEIKKQVEILIASKLNQNVQQNKLHDSSSPKRNEINHKEKNKYQNSFNNSENIAETNFNTNQPNCVDNMNDLESFNNINKKLNGKIVNNNLDKYYSKLNNINNNNINNIKDNKKIIRHKIHKSKIEELDKESELFNNNIFSPVINNYTPNSSFFFISSSFNNIKNKNKKNPNIALRNYFSKEEDIYYTENNPFFSNNNITNNSKEIKNNSKNKSMSKSMSLNGIHFKNYNKGKDLYERNIKYNEEKNEKLKILKKNLESDLDEDNTFAPKINKISKIQKEYRKQKKLEYSNPDIIKNYKKYRDDKIKLLKEKQEKEFEKNYTFKPKINNCSSIFKNIKSQKNNFKKIGNLLNIKKISRSNTHVNNNNFITKGCSKSITRFEKLYNERINIKENQNKLRQKIFNEFSFKPKINDKSHYLKLDKPFRERLKTYSNKSRENMIRIRKLYEKERESEESFHPKLNTEKNKKLLQKKRNDSNNLNDLSNNNEIGNKNIFIINHNKIKKINNKSYSNNNILILTEKNKKDKIQIGRHTKLYLHNEKYLRQKNILTEKKNKVQSNSHICCNNSEEIINKKREKYYKILFQLLDSDEDNKITSEHINIFSIPKKIQKILEPIFISLDEEKESLNQIEFIYVCKQLYNTLSYIDKKELFSYIKQEKENNNSKKEKKIKCSFRPETNKRNNSYQKFIVNINGLNNSQSTCIDKKSKENFNYNYYNLKNSVEIKNNEMILNKLHAINSGNTRSRKKTNGDYINNINLKKKIYISKIRIKNQSSLVNNYYLIKNKNNVLKNKFE